MVTLFLQRFVFFPSFVFDFRTFSIGVNTHNFLSSMHDTITRLPIAAAMCHEFRGTMWRLLVLLTLVQLRSALPIELVQSNHISSSAAV